MELARRLQNLSPYLSAKTDAMLAKAQAQGRDVITFGVGDPDQPTPSNIVEEAIKQVQNPENHNYPSYEGMKSYRQAVASFYQRYFGVNLNPDTEILTLIGSKEGIAHLPWCYLNPGDIALIPDPGYPVYKAATLLCNAIPHTFPLLEENGFLPDLDEIDEQTAKRAKLMFLNYPNNPTGAVAPREFFEEVIYFAYEYDIIVAHDATYSQIAFDGYRPPSILEIPRAKEIAVEFFSLSKPYNMTGWRIGACVGNPEVISALGLVKANVDSGVFDAIQFAGIEALTNSDAGWKKNVEHYKHRHDLVIGYLQELGWPVQPNNATFYLWIPVPKGLTSQEFSDHIFEKTDVFFTPGISFGESGEGYCRLSLTLSEEKIHEAFKRLKDAGIRFPK